MTVAGEGDVMAAATGDTTPFTFHVNPSTRPFADSREYRTDEQIDEARRTAETIENSEVVPPGGALTGEGIDIPIEIGSGVQWLDLESSRTPPTCPGRTSPSSSTGPPVSCSSGPTYCGSSTTPAPGSTRPPSRLGTGAGAPQPAPDPDNDLAATGGGAAALAALALGGAVALASRRRED